MDSLNDHGRVTKTRTIRSGGKLLLPPEFLEWMGWSVGDDVAIKCDGDNLIIEPAPRYYMAQALERASAKAVIASTMENVKSGTLSVEQAIVEIAELVQHESERQTENTIRRITAGPIT